MEYAIEINNLSRKYDGFNLNNINLKLPKGSIMGFIGENGAGKSTTIKLVLNMIKKNSGDISVFGLEHQKHEKRIKEDIGVVFDECNYPDSAKVKDINNIMKYLYKNWDSNAFYTYIAKFNLPNNKIIKDFSRGMKMKLSISVALSHNAKLLILDEPTSGLDPIVRDEILDIFLDFIQDENNSIFISSHITSDLEKIADYITFINQGNIIFSETKDNLLNKYCIIKCTHDQFKDLDKSIIVGYRTNSFGVEVLANRYNISGNYIIENANLENIMLFHIKGEEK